MLSDFFGFFYKSLPWDCICCLADCGRGSLSVSWTLWYLCLWPPFPYSQPGRGKRELFGFTGSDLGGWKWVTTVTLSPWGSETFFPGVFSVSSAVPSAFAHQQWRHWLFFLLGKEKHKNFRTKALSISFFYLIHTHAHTGAYSKMFLGGSLGFCLNQWDKNLGTFLLWVVLKGRIQQYIK